MSQKGYRHNGWTTICPPLIALHIMIVLLTGWLGSAEAQTGTISGKVSGDDGTPLVDAIVDVLGTNSWARTNSEGRYSISNVPVGSWSLRARLTGRMRMQTSVRVDAGRVTVENFSLKEDVVEIPGLVIRRPGKTEIRVKDSALRNLVPAEDLHALPIQSYQEAIELKAGVTSLKGQMHFRGGRSDEILTLINGIASRNPLRAEGVDLGMLAIISSEQVLGGMDAQYGNALSGVISLTTREGTEHFGGEVRYFTDRYGERDKSFNYYDRLSLGLGGPFLFPRTNYFLAFQGTYSDTYLRSTAEQQEHRFLDFVRLGNRQSNATNFSSKLTWRPSGDQKLNLELIRNSSLDGRFHNRWNRMGFVQVISDSAAPTDGSVVRRYGTWSYYPVDSTYIAMNTADHLPIQSDEYEQFALTWRHTLAIGKIYNLRASRQNWSSTTDVLDRQLWEYEQQPNQYYDPLNRVDGAYYVTNGDYPFYERRRTSTYTLNGDISTTVRDHSFMLGGDINYNDFEYLLAHFPNVLDANGDYGATRDEFRAYNPEGSFFVQDRWVYEGMVLNAGIRYDSFSVGTQVAEAQVSDPVKTQWSPRIGFAYPISDRDVMSFHYGRLFQVPDRLFIYQGRNISAEARGNPNLEPETTISYQLGVQHLFTDEIYGQFGVFFKDIFGLLTTVDQQIPDLAVTVPTYMNGDYATARGFEITLIKNHSRGYSGEINYTYANFSGTASDPNRALQSQGNLRDQFKPTSEVPLEWDQRHHLSAALRFGNEKDWAAAFVYQFGTGFPYTPEQRQQRRQDPRLINSERLPSTSALSVQAERFFQIWGQGVTFYLQATNLLDAKSIAELQPSLWPNNQVNPTSYIVHYTETGRAGGAFLTGDQDGDGMDDWHPVNDPRVYQQGRSIRIGLGIQF